jgi:hypothetical protein
MYDIDLSEEVLRSPYVKSVPNKFREKARTTAAFDFVPEYQGEERTYGLLITFFHTFCANGGLEAVFKIFEAGRGSPLSSGVHKPTGAELPLETVPTVWSIFGGTRLIIAPNVSHDIVAHAHEAFFKRIENLTNAEIKDLNKDNLSTAIDQMKEIVYLQSDDKTAWETTDKYALLFSLKLLSSPFLEKRLKGLSDITERIMDLRSHRGPFCWRYYTLSNLLVWMKEINLLLLLFNDDAHAEVLKRSHPILSFMAQHQTITPEDIDMLWGFLLNKHEDIARVVYEILVNIVVDLSWPVCLSIDLAA